MQVNTFVLNASVLLLGLGNVSVLLQEQVEALGSQLQWAVH